VAAQILTRRILTRLPARRTATILAMAGVFALSGCGGHSYNWGWYVVSPLDSRGLKNLAFLADGMIATVTLSLVAIAISVVLGAGLAIVGLSRVPALRALNRVYVEVFRAIPVLVLLLWVYYGLPVVAGIQFSVMAAGIATLALSDAAFESEIFRAGIQSVALGQSEAAMSLGLTRWQTMRFILLPQAIRRILPALGNQFVYVLKMSSLISVVGYQELTRRAQELVLIEYRPLEIYTMLVIEYLLLILVVSWLVRRLEARMAAGR
jgi:His/Glu/Gln/Arg/opine family amino acid ABC transporter permease subunit